jgi:hypothetical protein
MNNTSEEIYIEEVDANDPDYKLVKSREKHAEFVTIEKELAD